MSSQYRSPRDDQRTCCLCGGDQFRLLHGWESDHPRNSASIPLSVWQCQCGLATLHPFPTTEQLPAGGDWWTEERKFIKRRGWLKKVRKPAQNFIFGGQKQRFARQTRKAVAGGRVLDIGCGEGELLSLLSNWFECEGVEPSEAAAAESTRRGVKVTLGFFEDVELPEDSYDLVTMYSVLEHVYDPVAVLSKVNRVLKPGGIVAIKVPKLKGPAFHLHGREWNGYRVGYHTFLFTGESLGNTLNAAGFEVLRKPKRDRTLDDLLILWGRKVCTPQTAATRKAG